MIHALLPLALLAPALGLAAPALAVPTMDGSDDDSFDDTGDDANVPDRGEGGDDAPDAYIVNGFEAAEGEWPEVVHLAMRSGSGGGNCTGSLIHPEWVLTAAHCVDGDTSGVTVTFGETSSDRRKVEADEWIVHPDWQGEASGSFKGDVAVVRLAERVEDVFPMALNPDEMTEAWLDTEVTFIGYGIIRTGGGGGGIKRYAGVPVHSLPSTEPFLVNAYDGNQGTCQGDSGGPGVVFSGDGYVQVSTTSYGRRCGQDVSGHMRVDYYLGWIRETTGIEPVTRPGAPPDFVCSRETDPGDEYSVAVGVVDFDLRCQVIYHAPEELTTVNWQWGDGNTTEGGSVTHTYVQPGNFTVRMCAQGERDNGSTWEHCVPKNGYVRACDVPDVTFSAEPVDGLTWTFRNQTDVSTFGCISDLQWEVYDASGNLVDSLRGWEPEYTFPEPGDYRLVLNVGGIAGTGGAELNVEVRRGLAANCDAMALSGTGLGAFGLLLGLVAIRRRRD